ncbi:hypothetical protein [Streptomyces sp. H27-D2]|uniref:hypothetical protein n=1 Tax=Streptomyces sp. H27-D2 TaxID=3046304 RepID=UPI002DBB5E36|nr:hypothetical protein [Streptomyces sp. H27-D2]MEC4018489.1 hypothetical protein [Streptomyces sp. H27-D2]
MSGPESRSAERDSGPAKILASLEATVNLDLARNKSRSQTRSVAVTDHLTKKGQYYFYRGRRYVSGYWTGSVCSSDGTRIKKVSNGKAHSFGVKVDGAVRCGERVSKKSLGYKVKKQYC